MSLVIGQGGGRHACSGSWAAPTVWRTAIHHDSIRAEMSDLYLVPDKTTFIPFERSKKTVASHPSVFVVPFQHSKKTFAFLPPVSVVPFRRL